MLLHAAVNTHQWQVCELHQRFLDAVQQDHPDAAVCQAEYLAGQQAFERAEGTLRRKEEVLDIDEHKELEQLATSEYMRLRMNARALKLRLQERLRARRFEMDVVERAYRRLLNGEGYHIDQSAINSLIPTQTQSYTHTRSQL
jgi:ABC-type cobalamin transport system ATPase subunit